jgi:uncharacterized protein
MPIQPLHRRPPTPRHGEPALDTIKPLTDDDIERLQSLLAALPAPLEPPDLSALDGWLCGVLLQPQPLPPARWLGFVHDVEGRAAPAGVALDELHALVLRRHAELDGAIAARQWFDPWVAPPEDEDAPPSESVLPWVAGFAAALDAFPALTALDDPALVEPLALLYLHFDPDDLEDAEALAAVIETLEPPDDLAEAVQDLVRAVMLIADVSRPRPAAAPAPRRRPAARPGGTKPRRPRR